MVECFLAKEDVAGSTPVSRSNKTSSYVCTMAIRKTFQAVSPPRNVGLCDREYRGAVPKW